MQRKVLLGHREDISENQMHGMCGEAVKRKCVFAVLGVHVALRRSV